MDFSKPCGLDCDLACTGSGKSTRNRDQGLIRVLAPHPEYKDCLCPVLVVELTYEVGQEERVQGYGTHCTLGRQVGLVQ